MNSNKKIVFLGTPEFAVASLARLVDCGYDIAAVVTMPDKPAGRGHQLLQSPVKQFAVEHNIPVLQPANLKDTVFLATLASFNADLFVVIAFRMLPEVVWSMPPLGTFNLHASLLPQYRGAAPINHAVMNGEKHTGVTTFLLKHEIDTGDILNQKAIEIADDENVGSVHDRLMEIGAELTVKTVGEIFEGTAQPVSQDSLLTDAQPLKPAPKIFKETCRINWNSDAGKLHNFIRGLSPYPAAWTVIHNSDGKETEVKIMSAKCTDTSSRGMNPGEIRIENGEMLVATATNFLRVLTLRPAGKKMMDAEAYLRGARLVNPIMM